MPKKRTKIRLKAFSEAVQICGLIQRNNLTRAFYKRPIFLNNSHIIDDPLPNN